jgi:hypothetical protein
MLANAATIFQTRGRLLEVLLAFGAEHLRASMRISQTPVKVLANAG